MNLGICRWCGKEVTIPDEDISREWMETCSNYRGTQRTKVEQAMMDAAEKWSGAVSHQVCIERELKNRQRKEYDHWKTELLKKWAKGNPFPDTVFDRLPFTTKHEALAAWNNPETSVLLVSQASGRGKTRLAWLMLQHPFLSGKKVRAFSHIGLKNTLAEKASKGQGYMELFVKQLIECDVLLVDDLGKANMRGSSGDGLQNEEQMFHILDTRLTMKRKSIFTSNDNGETLLSRMSENRGVPLVRRLRELAVAFDG